MDKRSAKQTNSNNRKQPPATRTHTLQIKHATASACVSVGTRTHTLCKLKDATALAHARSSVLRTCPSCSNTSMSSASRERRRQRCRFHKAEEPHEFWSHGYDQLATWQLHVNHIQQTMQFLLRMGTTRFGRHTAKRQQSTKRSSTGTSGTLWH